MSAAAQVGQRRQTGCKITFLLAVPVTYFLPFCLQKFFILVQTSPGCLL